MCPECQRSAAVGVQCVTCVNEQNRGMRRPRTVLGGSVGSGDATVTKALIGVCVVMYAARFVLPEALFQRLTLVNAPDVFAAAFAAGNWWQPLTSAFLHAASPMHLLFNMLGLWVAGSVLESQLGRSRFLALYLLSALGGAAGATLLPGTVGTSLVGASGAVFGLYAATFLVSRRLGRHAGQVAGLFAVSLLFGILSPNVSWQGHLGGFLAGGAAAAVLAYAPRARRALVQWAGLALLGAVLVALLAYAALRLSVGAALLG